MSFDPNAAAQPGSGIFGLLSAPADAQVIVIPVPFDATTSYRAGTAQGPSAILEASKQVDLFDRVFGKPYEAGIAMLEIPEEVLAWNVEARRLAEPIIAEGGTEKGDARLGSIDALCDKMNHWVHAQAQRWLQAGKRIALVGGDHSTPFGAIQAVSERYPGVGVLHLDAHADLRDAYEGFQWSHASIMHNVFMKLPKVGKLVQVGIRDYGEAEHELIAAHPERVRTFFDDALADAEAEGMPFVETAEQIVELLPKQVYLSWDIDGLEPTLCPHTGTPVPGGLSFRQAQILLESVVDSGREIVGVDLNEVAPGPDGDEWDANVGARLLYKMIGAMLKSRMAP